MSILWLHKSGDSIRVSAYNKRKNEDHDGEVDAFHIEIQRDNGEIWREALSDVYHTLNFLETR